MFSLRIRLKEPVTEIERERKCFLCLTSMLVWESKWNFIIFFNVVVEKNFWCFVVAIVIVAVSLLWSAGVYEWDMNVCICIVVSVSFVSYLFAVVVVLVYAQQQCQPSFYSKTSVCRVRVVRFFSVFYTDRPAAILSFR